jgi:hypothetical protein
VHVVEQRRARQFAEDRRRQVRDLGAVERPDRHERHVRHPAEAGQQQPQRMASRQLVAAVRQDDHDRQRRDGVHDVGDEIQCRPVRPVQVVDREGERRSGRRAFEQGGGLLEEAHLAVIDEQR